MALNTLTLVSQINNLSDARYCAGMGVDILSFVLTEGQAGYLAPDAINDIAGWIAGVQIAGEFYDSQAEEINQLAEICNLSQALLTSIYLVDELTMIKVPVIQQLIINKDTIEEEFIRNLEVYKDYVSSFLINSDDFTTIDETIIPFLKDIASQFPIILGFGLNKENVLLVAEQVKPMGIALQGGQEIKPGLKSFDALADILELLEE
ncbi:MAG: hypothetical protein COW65_10980 [Cytophagales bacterium CG18_big_fil_WC_8_21_14_2_50_42_9]|nr:MAG: hypothetical protein COW65_10980 [Cytophagales bacterium CG18_big_fil_WC_8_21_14_2_50_42_9]